MKVTQTQPGVQAPISFEEQSRILVVNLFAGKFSDIEQTLTAGVENFYLTRGGSYYSGAVLTYLFSAYSDSLDTNWLYPLNTWVQQFPNSSLAYTVRAHFYYHYGWKLRGTRYASKTPAAAMEAYLNQMTLSARDIEKALELDPNNPIALRQMLALGRNLGMPRDVFEDYFQRAVDRVPFLLQAYQEKALYLDPRWYGNEQELLAFAREAVQAAPRGTAIPLVLVQAHEDLCYHYPDRSSYYNRAGVWAEVKANYRRLLEDFPQAGLYAMWFSQAAEDAGRNDESRQYMLEALSREPNNPRIQARAKSLGISIN